MWKKAELVYLQQKFSGGLPRSRSSVKIMPEREDLIANVYTELGGWGMPTIDAEGLAALALLRFADIPFTVKTGASRSMTNANILPVIVFDRGPKKSSSMCAGLASLVGLMASDMSLPDLNISLTPYLVAESTAFTSLLQSRFGPARLHELFCDTRNYATIYHTLLEKERSFPLNHILPFVRRREIRNSLQNDNVSSLYFNSGVALTALSTRLGERRKFFHGDKPTVLDAVVYGYLASVMYTPLPVSKLRRQIAKFKNLVDFAQRITETYFGGSESIRIDGCFDANEISSQLEDDILQHSRLTTDGDPLENSRDETEEEKQRKKWNRYFIWGSVAAFAAHVLLGNEIEIDLS